MWFATRITACLLNYSVSALLFRRQISSFIKYVRNVNNWSQTLHTSDCGNEPKMWPEPSRNQCHEVRCDSKFDILFLVPHGLLFLYSITLNKCLLRRRMNSGLLFLISGFGSNLEQATPKGNEIKKLFYCQEAFKRVALLMESKNMWLSATLEKIDIRFNPVQFKELCLSLGISSKHTEQLHISTSKSK